MFYPNLTPQIWGVRKNKFDPIIYYLRMEEKRKPLLIIPLSVRPEYLKWLSLLVDLGSSLGGARPKAGVLDE
jgi:hypothetical protein